MRTLLVTLMLTAVVFAGCASAPEEPPAEPEPPAVAAPEPTTDLEQLLNESVLAGEPQITLFESLVDVPQIDQLHDPYEPTMEVCDDGNIYVTGHTFLVDTTGAPVFGSDDNGDSWFQLPWTQDQTLPAGVPGSTPPVSDEIFLACGDDGWLYGGDITLASYPVNAWSGHGTFHEYWNFNAYNEADVALQATDCVARPVKDRPWTAYNNGTLLVTSNPAGAQNQIGVVDVPFASPSPYSYGTVIDGIEWNLCAGPGGSIPGVPDINSQGMFAAPQKSGGSLVLTIGHKSDVMDVRNVPLFSSQSGGEITSHYGHAAFDKHDTLFVGISTNLNQGEDSKGRMTFAVSTDDGETFQTETFETGDKVLRHFYMDPNRFGPGALVVWAVNNETSGFDWYMGHLYANETGAPYFGHVSMVIAAGPAPSAHVTGAALGPDGRAYTAMYIRSQARLSVFIQDGGPVMELA